MKKKICFFTGTRAEYGILKNLLDKATKSTDFQTQLVVSGTHLSPEFGYSMSEIEQDGFYINDKVEILLSSDTPVGMSKSMGLGFTGYAETLNRLKPDMVMVIGDRYESLAFAIVSSILRIPIAHIHGGEITEGAIDDSFRHCITKMSQLHFTSTEEYRKRVIQLGEHPDTVFHVGALGIDTIKKTKLISKSKLQSDLDIVFNKNNLLVTFHPETMEPGMSRIHFGNLLEVLNELKDTMIIFTKSNADPEGRAINRMIDEFVNRNGQIARCFTSLGVRNYFSVMQFVDAVVGNSSSGIIEAPSFKIGTINIGERQKGRIKANSVIDCLSTKDGIEQAIETLFSKDFQRNLSTVKNPYGEGNSAWKIIEILQQKMPYISNTKKTFYDIAF